ncbi:MAG: hypothetical protein ACOYNC_00930 [Bacteroidales bacterium]
MSKSIFQVIGAQLSQYAWKITLVGVLILALSVFATLIKLASSFLIRAGVFKGDCFTLINSSLGKCSTADVFMVALFMAYLGINELISSVFLQLEQNNADELINTANNTHFRQGLIFFTWYTFISILSSYLLKIWKEARLKPA